MWLIQAYIIPDVFNSSAPEELSADLLNRPLIKDVQTNTRISMSLDGSIGYPYIPSRSETGSR